MSFREKSAWISMLSMAGIYGYYFLSLAPGPVAGRGAAVPFVPLLAATIAALVVVQVVLHVAVAIHRPQDARAPRDERERQIDLKAARVAYYGLASGVALACLLGALHPPVLFLADSLLFVLVAAELLRCACQIVYYRRDG